MRKQQIRGSMVSLICMIVITCVTQVVTLMKSSVVAGEFGTSEAMDAYNFANSIFSFILGVITAGVPTVILPAYVKQNDKNGINSFITVLYGGLLGLFCIIVLLRYQIVDLFTNRSDLFVDIACNVLLILAVSQYLSSITGVTIAYVHHKCKYNMPKIVNLFTQLVVLAALILRNDMDIYDYTITISCGLFITFAVDTIYAVGEGWRFAPRLSLKNEVTIDLLHTFFPILFSSSAYKLSLFVDSLIASNLEEGKLTMLNYSNMIVGMVSTLIIGNILTFIYPKLIKRLKDGDDQAYFWDQVSFFHMIVCLLIVGFFAVGKEGIALLFQRGLFDANATKYVYLGALIYMSGQQFNIVRDMVYRYFYCMGNTKTPAQNSVLVSIMNIIISLILVYLLGFFGIIIGTVVASAFSTIIIIVRFHKTVKLNRTFNEFIQRYVKSIVAMLGTGMIVLLTKAFLNIENEMLSILLFGSETVLIFGVLIFAINRHVLRAAMVMVD